MSSAAGPSSFPFPGIATVILGATLWNPLLVALAGGTGSTIGEIAALSCRIGLLRRGQENRRSQPLVREMVWSDQRMDRGARHDHIFLFAATPNPFFDLAGFAAGSMKYPISRFVVACWLGKMVKYAVVTYAAIWSADMVYGWFE